VERAKKKLSTASKHVLDLTRTISLSAKSVYKEGFFESRGRLPPSSRAIIHSSGFFGKQRRILLRRTHPNEKDASVHLVSLSVRLASAQKKDPLLAQKCALVLRVCE